MIRGYTDHAANERTFLAWLRTGIAVIAFGFVVEKFNLFVLTIASAAGIDGARRSALERLSGPLSGYEGPALIAMGIVIVIVAAIRFVRVRRMLEDQQIHSVGNSRTELVLAGALVLMISAFSIYLVLYHTIG